VEMTVSKVVGMCLLSAGFSWTAACFVHNSQPQGCVGDACLTGQMRGTTPAADALFILAGALLAVSVAGLLFLVRRLGHLGRVGWVGGLACAAGLLLFLAAGITIAFVDSNWDGMPLLVIPGLALLVAGLLLVGWTVWKAQIMPPVLSLVLIATVLLLPFANEQTSHVLLAVPFGLACTATGLYLVTRPTVEPRVQSTDGTANSLSTQ
jgi:hypothetical protein